jgi:hypothetical protein
MPLTSIFKNKIQLYKQLHIGDDTIDNWFFWVLQDKIDLVNEMNKDEEKSRKAQEDDQKSTMHNMNPSSYMKGFSGMTSKFK